MNDQITYQKLFNINYNNKIFTIFIDKYGRRNFLEQVSNNKYRYPNINDFINLNKIYNERNPFISYESKDKLPTHKPKKVIFKEAVIGTTGLISIILTGIIGINSIRYSYKLNKQNDFIEMIPTYTSTKFDESNVLDTYLGTSSVPLEELINVINNNPNIDDIYKENAIKLAKYIHDKYPNTDNRIFYDNMKNLAIEELEDNEENKHIAGSYNSLTNVISIKNRDDTEEKSTDSNSFENEVIIHELSHAYHCWANRGSENPYYRSSNIGHSLDEAMNNKVIEGLFENSTHTYQREGKLLNYLLTFVSYTYYDYEQGGIDKLYNLLKENYPEVDIDYIFNFSDTMCTASLKQGQYINIEEEPEYLDCLFNLCIHNINYNNKYESLVNFFKLIDYNNYPDLVTKYTNEYNDILKEKGISNNLINSSNILNYVRDYISIKSFDDYLNDLNVDEIDINDVYKPLKDFFLTKSSNNIFIELLNKYNNYLISNGISEDRIIKSNEFNDKYKNYQNISIRGYLITTYGNIYLWVDIPEKDQIYNTETRTPIIGKDGKITLIDNKYIDQKSIADKLQNIFTYYLFEDNKKDFSWYNDNFFNKEYNISQFDYRKVNITLNGKFITNDYLDNLIVNIGISEDGDYTFKLTDRDNNILYSVGNPSIKIPFYLNEYLNLSNYKDTIELTNYFNKEYLKQFALNNEVNISNKEYISYDNLNDKIIFKQRPTIILNNNIDNEIDINTIYINRFYDEKLGSTNNFICINKSKYILPDELGINVPIFLSEVLKYYGLFDENKFPYKFTTEEIINLFNNYLNDNLINVSIMNIKLSKN